MTPPPPLPPEEHVRPHVYDGITEYDKRLPNWWLYTLYATIVYAAIYWGYYQWLKVGPTGVQDVTAALGQIERQRLSVAKMDDESLWKMSRNAAFVEAGKTVYLSNCAACHLPSLRGKSENPTAIGSDLTDRNWIHGGRPIEVHDVIEKGVIVKGMPTWGPVLGTQKISEVTAFLLSVHREGEPILRTPAATP